MSIEAEISVPRTRITIAPTLAKSAGAAAVCTKSYL